jgi:hypothetical protein
MFRFTIRDVLWLMMVVGLACGWWMDRRGMQSQIAELTALSWRQAVLLAKPVIDGPGSFIADDSVAKE